MFNKPASTRKYQTSLKNLSGTKRSSLICLTDRNEQKISNIVTRSTLTLNLAVTEAGARAISDLGFIEQQLASIQVSIL